MKRNWNWLALFMAFHLTAPLTLLGQSAPQELPIPITPPANDAGDSPVVYEEPLAAPTPPQTILEGAPIGSGVRTTLPSQPARPESILQTPAKQELIIRRELSDAPSVKGETQLVQPDTTLSDVTSSADETNGSTEAIELGLSDSVTSVVPIVSVECTGPTEVNVGIAATYRIKVENLGDQIASDVFLDVGLPSEVTLAKSKPEATLGNGIARFSLGNLKVKEKRELVLQVQPTTKGKVKLAARVSFSAMTGIEIAIRQPTLSLESSTPKQVNAGSLVTHKIVLTNKGDGPIDGIIVRPAASDGLEIQAVNKSQGDVGFLGAGQSREVFFQSIAKKAGEAAFEYSVSGSGGFSKKAIDRLVVVNPQLKAEISGPEKTFLSGVDTYSISVSNPGETASEGVRVILSIPEGFQVTTTDREGRYSALDRSLTWQLPSIGPGSVEKFQFKAKATIEGELITRVQATAKNGQPSVAELKTTALSHADLSVSLEDAGTPVHDGDHVGWVVTLTNKGTKEALGTVVRVDVPEALLPIESEHYTVDGQTVLFEPINVPARSRVVLKVATMSNGVGEHVVKVSVATAELNHELHADNAVVVYDLRRNNVAGREVRD